MIKYVQLTIMEINCNMGKMLKCSKLIQTVFLISHNDSVKERKKERQTDTQTDTQTDRQTDRQADGRTGICY